MKKLIKTITIEEQLDKDIKEHITKTKPKYSSLSHFVEVSSTNQIRVIIMPELIKPVQPKRLLAIAIIVVAVSFMILLLLFAGKFITQKTFFILISIWAGLITLSIIFKYKDFILSFFKRNQKLKEKLQLKLHLSC